ncbi:MAG: hypothetical protein DA330_09860 [Nitrososphaera sp.]|nr:hypothetical protein [Nitrososphaera sp.]
MAKLTITDRYVRVDLYGIKQFLALKSSLTIPITSISKVSTEKIRWLVFAAKAGTNFPGLLMAGTFFRRGGMVFYYVRDPSKCVSLTLDNHRYRKVIVQVDDKEKTAERIRRLIRK